MPNPKKPKVIPIESEPETCGSCKYLRGYDPGDVAGFCYGRGRKWREKDGEGEWAYPEHALIDYACDIFKQKLNS